MLNATIPAKLLSRVLPVMVKLIDARTPAHAANLSAGPGGLTLSMEGPACRFRWTLSPVQVDAAGSVGVPARILAQAVRHAGGDSLQLRATATRLHVVAGAPAAEIVTSPAPVPAGTQPPFVPEGQATITGRALEAVGSAIGAVAGRVGADGFGVKLAAGAGRMVAEAVDGRSLIQANAPGDDAGTSFVKVLPTEALPLLAAFGALVGEGNVLLAAGENVVRAIAAQGELSLATLGKTFPSSGELIVSAARAEATEARVAPRELIDGIRRVAWADRETAEIRGDPRGLVLRGDSDRAGIVSRVPARIVRTLEGGGGVYVAKQLLEALDAVSDARVVNLRLPAGKAPLSVRATVGGVDVTYLQCALASHAEPAGV